MNLTKEQAIERLREFFPRGSTVYTVLRHRSRSGMQRTIGVVALRTSDGFLFIYHPNMATAEALGLREDRKRDGVIMGGCGQDMGFSLARQIATACYGDDGDGYALKHEWI